MTKIIKNCITENKVDTIFHTAAFKHVSLVEKIFHKQYITIFMVLNYYAN